MYYTYIECRAHVTLVEKVYMMPAWAAKKLGGQGFGMKHLHYVRNPRETARFSEAPNKLEALRHRRPQEVLFVICGARHGMLP